MCAAYSGTFSCFSAAPGRGRGAVLLQAVLDLTDDRRAKARCEQTWSEGPGAVFPEGWESSQRSPGRRRHVVQLPTHLLVDRLVRVRCGQPSRLGGIRGSTQRMCTHVSDARCLPHRSGGGHRSRRADIGCGAASDESPADLVSGAQLSASERTHPSDPLPGAKVMRGFRLEQHKDPLRAVCRPGRHDSAVRLAQRLRRSHLGIVSDAHAPVS
jgi:hypothetical protein